MRQLHRALLLLALLAPAPAHAALRLGLGADYWLTEQAGFQATLQPETRLAKKLALGGRFGLFVTGGPTELAVPVDLALRVTPGRFYVEGLVGPWLFLSGGDVLHPHAGLGFGINAGDLSFGLEAAYLRPEGMVGLRVGFAL